MTLGILSDTHDNLPQIEKAVRFFNRHKVGLVLHAGDFVAPFAVDRLKQLACEWRGVFGNNDGEKAGLAKKSDGRIQKAPLRVTVEEKRITLVHDLLTVDVRHERADIIVFGHTHKPEVATQGRKLLVNPGECGGWLTGKSTVALLDLKRGSARITTL